MRKNICVRGLYDRVWSFINTSADCQNFLHKILQIVYVEMHNKAQGVRGCIIHHSALLHCSGTAMGSVKYVVSPSRISINAKIKTYSTAK